MSASTAITGHKEGYKTALRTSGIAGLGVSYCNKEPTVPRTLLTVPLLEDVVFIGLLVPFVTPPSKPPVVLDSVLVKFCVVEPTLFVTPPTTLPRPVPLVAFVSVCVVLPRAEPTLPSRPPPLELPVLADDVPDLDG